MYHFDDYIVVFSTNRSLAVIVIYSGALLECSSVGALLLFNIQIQFL
jgi:hypothetical protein